jgi:hypothetical protein
VHAKFACANSHGTVQSHQYFASSLGEQLFELKNEDGIKKSEDLYVTHVLAKAYPLTLFIARSNAAWSLDLVIPPWSCVFVKYSLEP